MVWKICITYLNTTNIATITNKDNKISYVLLNNLRMFPILRNYSVYTFCS
jgi:hypothetical protein